MNKVMPSFRKSNKQSEKKQTLIRTEEITIRLLGMVDNFGSVKKRQIANLYASEIITILLEKVGVVLSPNFRANKMQDGFQIGQLEVGNQQIVWNNDLAGVNQPLFSSF